MKKHSLKLACTLFFSLLVVHTVFAQTEVFEQDVSGFRAYTGLKWNPKIMQPLLGAEYTIEGRTSLGIQTGMPLSDTMFSAPDTALHLSTSKVHSYFLNPYAEFEFLESDVNNKISLALKAEYIFESAPTDSGRNNYRRHSFGIATASARAGLG